MASLRTAVSRAVARDKAEGGRTPTLSQLVQPKAQRTLSREADAWVDNNEVVDLLESLAAHLLRTLPISVLEEMDKWVDMQKGRKAGGAAAAILDTDVSDPVPEKDVVVPRGMTLERATWSGKRVHVLTVLKVPPPMAAPELRAHQYRLACTTATAPFLAAVRHEALLPVYGHVVTEQATSTLHPLVPANLRTLLQRRTKRRLSCIEVLRVGIDVMAAVGHLHALGFLHRNVNCAAVTPRMPVSDLEQLEAVAERELEHVILGDFTFALRTSRGRVTTPNWLPACHAPETAHNRTFDWGTDVYAIGLLLLEACFYGDQAAAIQATGRDGGSLDRSSRCPAHVPARLWTRLIAPCLMPLPDQRHTVPSARAAAQKLLEEYETAGPAATEYIPFPTDGMDAQTLTALQQAGAPPTAIRDAEVSCTGLQAAGWRELARALEKNTALTALRVASSEVDLDALHLPVGGGGLRCLALEKCSRGHVAATSNSPSGCKWAASLCRFFGPALRELNLQRTFIGDAEGARVVAAVAEQCPGLITLGLAHTGASKETADALIAATHGGQLGAVATLDLSGNAWPASSFAALCAQSLQRSASLRVLQLREVALDYFSVGNLAQVVRQSASIETIDLRGVQLSEPGLWLLASARHANTVSRAMILIDDALESSQATTLRAACRTEPARV
jgi:hypothetical protein